jgi:maltose/moltooligosaccharide transporter
LSYLIKKNANFELLVILKKFNYYFIGLTFSVLSTIVISVMKEEKASMKGYYGITFIIGLGFFTMGLMDPLYDTYVPMFLTNYLRSDGIVGLIMGIDNLFALMLIPIVSALSDKTRTPIGRRMPYILVTLPMTAIFFGILPLSALRSLAFLVIIIFFLNVFKQAARGPVVALMPDIIPGDLRSEANGVINTMGGIAAIVGTVFLARLYDIDIVLPLFGNTLIPFPGSSVRTGENASVGTLPFLASAFLVILAAGLLFLFVKEKQAAKSEEGEERIPVLASLKMIFTAEDKSALFILFSILFWFVGYQGVLPWIGIYGVDFLGLTPGTAALSAGMVGIAYAIFAIPSGIVAHKIGRKKTIRVSLIILTVLTFLMFFHYPLTSGLGIPRPVTLGSFWFMLFLFGIFWVAVVTNSFPMLWQMATFANIGIYTGLYYFFSQGAGIVGPGIAGGLRDIFGPRVIFLSAGVCTFIAFVLMGFVKRGEPEDDSISVEPE